MRARVFIAAFALFGCSVALAAPPRKAYRSLQKFSLAEQGTFVLENRMGDVTVESADVPGVEATVVRVITGKDADAIEEGRRSTSIVIGGDDRTRIVRTVVPKAPNWEAVVHWIVRIPRGAGIRVISHSSRAIRIGNVRGDVQVKNFNGNIVLEHNSGAVLAESVNGSMLYRMAAPRTNVVLRSVNGTITAAIHPGAGVRWVAETIKGDVRTNLPARGAFFGPVFRGSVNAPGGPTITTATLTGHVQLISIGSAARNLQSLRSAPAATIAHGGGSREAAVRGVVDGHYSYAINVGDIRVQEIRGDGDLYTGAGEVQLGAVSGKLQVRSLGGPLQLGEVLGRLTATTRAGDILIDSARQGGMIRTQGGTIQLLYTSGPTSLYSGGGDVTVRQAAGRIDAVTRSGDIHVTIDPSLKTNRVDLSTRQGNVTLNVTPQFAADIDATVLTSNPQSDAILSDIPGLSISRDEFQGKTRIRAKGKINGGGDTVVLRATDGDIRISTRPIRPTVVTRR